MRMISKKWIFLVLMPALLTACAPVVYRSEADVLKYPLARAVDAAMLETLLAIAVKDRECRAVPDRRFGMHSPIYEAYSHCMYKSESTACEGTAADFATAKALFSRDPRLPRVIDFDALFARVSEQCSARGKALPVNLGQIPSLNARQLRECSVVPHQPLLIALAVRMRWPNYEDGDEQARWGSTCAGVKGLYFFGEHCKLLQFDGRRIYDAYSGGSREFIRPKEFGPEDYVCPTTYDHWRSR
jgi:hypothetical protein